MPKQVRKVDKTILYGGANNNGSNNNGNPDNGGTDILFKPICFWFHNNLLQLLTGLVLLKLKVYLQVIIVVKFSSQKPIVQLTMIAPIIMETPIMAAQMYFSVLLCFGSIVIPPFLFSLLNNTIFFNICKYNYDIQMTFVYIE